MEGFNVESKGLTRGEFTQAVHRLGRSFFLWTIGIGIAVYVLILIVAGYNSLFILFPGSVVVALLVFYEMKAQANYGKFDYEDAVFHFRFEPDRWVIIRGRELSTRAEYTWAETAHLWETSKDLLLVPVRKGGKNYTLPKRSLTQEQLEAIRGWYSAGRGK